MYKYVYLSGAITGLHPEEAAKRFAEVAEEYRWSTTVVVNPMSLVPFLERREGRRLTESEILLKELEILVHCDEVVMLPGWEKSVGAVMEHNMAKKAEIKITYL